MPNYLRTLVRTQKYLWFFFCCCCALDACLVFYLDIFSVIFLLLIAVNICVLTVGGRLRWLWLSGSHSLIFLLCVSLFVGSGVVNKIPILKEAGANSKSSACFFSLPKIQKRRDLENRVRVRQDHWKCRHVIEHNDFLLTFYSNCGSIWCRFWEIQCRKISRPWNPGQGSVKVIESGTIRQTGYDFLLVFLSNFVPKKHRFLRYSTSKIPWPRKIGLGIRQDRWKCYHSIERMWFPINVP